MSEEVMRKHIDLYVNKFSLDLGKPGKESIHALLKIHQNITGANFDLRKNIFVDQ
jgi:1,4-dihydroxy-6-naphthoate synthase